MRPSRYSDDIEMRSADIYRGQRAPVKGGINALIELYYGAPSLMNPSAHSSKLGYAGYLVFQISSTVALVGIPLTGFVLLLSE